MIVRSYGERVTQKPQWAGRRDGLFVSAMSSLGSVGRVIDVLDCEDVELRDVFMTWVVDVVDPVSVPRTSGGSSDVEVRVHIPMEVQCGLIVSR